MNGIPPTDYLAGEDVASLVESRASHAKGGPRMAAEKYWRVNLLAYSGEPYYRVNEAGRLEEIDPAFRDRYVYVNLAFQTVQTLAGRMTYEPKVEASPGAAWNTEQIFRARAAADLGNHGIRVSKFPEARRDIMVLCHTAGLGWAKVFYDPAAGRSVVLYGQKECPECRGTGMIQNPYSGQDGPCPTCVTEGVVDDPQAPPPEPGKILDVLGEKPQGEVVVESVPPWEIYSDPEAGKLSRSRWIIHERDMSRTKFLEMLMDDERYAQMTEDDLDQGNNGAGEMPFTLRAGDGWDRPSRREYIQVREFWELPSAKFPRGLYVLQAGTTVYKAGPLPYAHMRLPFVPYSCYEVPGQLYPKSTLDMVLPLIHTANDHLSNINARAHQSVQMRILAPARSNVRVDDRRAIVSYEHAPGRPEPKELNIGPPPADAGQMVDYMINYVDSVSGAVDVMRGQAGDGVESARAGAWFDEQAMNRLKPLMDSHVQSDEAVVRLIIETQRLFYEDGRIFSVLGSHGTATAQAFKLDDVGGSDDVQIRVMRNMGLSKSARLQMLNEAYQLTGLKDPLYNKLSEMFDDGAMHEERRMHESCAVQENNYLRTNGVMDMAHDFEDHGIHMEVHVKMLHEFRMRNPQDPRIQAIEQHVLMHKQKQAQEQFEAQMAMQGDAAAYGQANAADPNAQPAQTVEAAQDAGMTAEAAPDGMSSPPETQPSLDAADASAMAAGQ